MQDSEGRLSDRFIVELARGLSSSREQRTLTTSFEHLKVSSAGLRAYPEKVANRAAAQATVVRQDDHGSITVGQASLVKAIKQDREVRDIADLIPQRRWADLFLEDSSHPLERALPSLLSHVAARCAYSHPSYVADNLLSALDRYKRRVGTGQQGKEANCLLLL